MLLPLKVNLTRRTWRGAEGHEHQDLPEAEGSYLFDSNVHACPFPSQGCLSGLKRSRRHCTLYNKRTLLKCLGHILGLDVPGMYLSWDLSMET